ncbi:MAG: uroporphyrinogen decarboxylase [Legionellales bacterium RIFCSPHIGHO2_12_FULL_35_11]|nr:MAG: uroporphyrinogen decarboxylase [Legionellales bacterium RIFCSPHIGHO2_12_FULL_35_11]
MQDLSNSLFMRSINHLPVPRPPVWLMRQAGRYLPEYRKTRAIAGDFLGLCKNKELACEVTLQPLRRYELDAAILFSDILTIPDAMGLGLSFTEGSGPSFANPLRNASDIYKLSSVDVKRELNYVMEATSLIRQEMPKELPLIGFSGSPWTLACYMVEGGGSKDFKNTLKLMYNEAYAFSLLLEKLSVTIFEYLELQILAGVNAVMIFDTWGGILSTHNYQAFSLKYMTRITKQLRAKYPNIPVLLFTKGGGQWLSLIADSSCNVIGLDWTCDLAKAKLEIGSRVALQGNLDPTVLLTSKKVIQQEVRRILEAVGDPTGFIFNLGHGITPDVPPENVTIMIDAIHEFYLDNPRKSS